MQWAIATAAFLASAVEFVEAFTIVLVVGITINWRSSLLGAFAAAVTLAIIIATLGVALVKWIPINDFRLIVGTILILFGLKWLKKAILRYSGLKALHDEEAIFEETMAEIRARGETIEPRFQPFGVVLSYKSVLLEGLEVAFIVITFGSSATISTGINGITSAAIGATVAGILVIVAGVIIKAPLTKIPENTLKFIVGIMLTSFGTFWAAEGFGKNFEWPLSDAFIPILVVIYLLVSYGLVTWLKWNKQHQLAMANTSSVSNTTTEQEEVRS
jgi:uncharacterized membrane protein